MRFVIKFFLQKKRLLNKNFFLPYHLVLNLYFLGFIIIIVMTGCSQYQYLTISSDINKNEKNEFINEDDTASIKYTFNGENCPIKIGIYNKLQQPIFVDLGQSCVIVDGKKNAYLNDNIIERVTFIPPLSYIDLPVITIKSIFFNLGSMDSLTKSISHNQNGQVDLKTHLFEEKNTPLYFRSYLTLSTHEDFASVRYFDTSFWISGIAQSTYSPSSLGYEPSNQSYLRRTTGFGTIMGCTALVGLLFLIGLTNSGN